MTTTTKKRTTTSSSNVCFRFLASITLVLAFAIAGLVYVDNQESLAATQSTPGLDFGTGRMFDSIASRYDFINRVLAMNMDIGWRRQMTQRLGAILIETTTLLDSKPWRILDIATGTADVALQLVDDLQQIHPTTVLGLDPSENMLAVGRTKIANRNLQSSIVLESADARDLQAYGEQKGTFDAATVAFGIRNVVPNRQKALCEIHKLLKPNGVLAILEFSDPSYETDGLLGAAAGLFIRQVVPVIGSWLSGGAKDEYKHLQNSIREFPGPKEFKNQLENLNCPREDGHGHVTVGHYAVDEVVSMNFGSVQLYIGRAVITKKQPIQVSDAKDKKLPPIGGAEL